MDVFYSQAGECLIVVLGPTGRVLVGPAEGDLGSPQRPPKVSCGVLEGCVLSPQVAPVVLQCDDLELISHWDGHFHFTVPKLARYPL